MSVSVDKVAHFMSEESIVSREPECAIVEVEPGQWFYAIDLYGDHEELIWDWRDNAKAFGPFDSELEAKEHMASNRVSPRFVSVLSYLEFEMDSKWRRLIEEASTNWLNPASHTAR